MVVMAVAIAGIAACGWDLRTQRIPNALTFGTALAGVAFHLTTGGWASAGASLAGLLVGTALFLPLFAVRGMGAGDVKLLGAFGAWLGPATIVPVAIAAALIGAVVALALVVVRGRTARTAANLSCILASWSAQGPRTVNGITIAEPSGLALCYSLPITAGAFVVMWVS